MVNAKDSTLEIDLDQFKLHLKSRKNRSIGGFLD